MPSHDLNLFFNNAFLTLLNRLSKCNILHSIILTGRLIPGRSLLMPLKFNFLAQTLYEKKSFVCMKTLKTLDINTFSLHITITIQESSTGNIKNGTLCSRNFLFRKKKSSSYRPHFLSLPMFILPSL